MTNMDGEGGQASLVRVVCVCVGGGGGRGGGGRIDAIKRRTPPDVPASDILPSPPPHTQTNANIAACGILHTSAGQQGGMVSGSFNPTCGDWTAMAYGAATVE